MRNASKNRFPMTGCVRPRGIGAGHTIMFLTIFLLRIIKTEPGLGATRRLKTGKPPPQ
ncbi:MAG: hypothetical protein ACK56F_13760 [bacterium]